MSHELYLNHTLVDPVSAPLLVKSPCLAVNEKPLSTPFLYTFLNGDGVGNILLKKIGDMSLFVCHMECPVQSFDNKIHRKLIMGVNMAAGSEKIFELTTEDCANNENCAENSSSISLKILGKKKNSLIECKLRPDYVDYSDEYESNSLIINNLKKWGLPSEIPQRVDFLKTWNNLIKKANEGDFGPPKIFSSNRYF